MTTSVVPETRFACLGSERIAYQVYGSGPIDLVINPARGEHRGEHLDEIEAALRSSA